MQRDTQKKIHMMKFTKILLELLLTDVKTVVVSCKKTGGLLKHI